MKIPQKLFREVIKNNNKIEIYTFLIISQFINQPLGYSRIAALNKRSKTDVYTICKKFIDKNYLKIIHKDALGSVYDFAQTDTKQVTLDIDKISNLYLITNLYVFRGILLSKINEKQEYNTEAEKQMSIMINNMNKDI